MVLTISLKPPKNQRQWNVNYFWHCMIDNTEGFAATLPYIRTIAHISRQNMVVTISEQSPKHDHQQSIPDYWPCTMENARAAWRHQTVIELLATFLCENDCDNIASMS
jgi:hypothetical protein